MTKASKSTWPGQVGEQDEERAPSQEKTMKNKTSFQKARTRNRVVEMKER